MPGNLRPDPMAVRSPGPFLNEGTALTNAVAVSRVMVVAGLARWRIRWKSTCAGTLTARYIRANNTPTDDEFTADQPGDAAIAANTENKIEDLDHMGEGLLKITFTPSANGVVTYAEFMGV